VIERTFFVTRVTKLRETLRIWQLPWER